MANGFKEEKFNKKSLGRRALAMCMALVLSMSLLQVAALATGSSTSGDQIQKNGSGSTVYYTYNNNNNNNNGNSNNGFPDTGIVTDPVVKNRSGSPDVTVTKTIAGTDTENQFKITLNVQTNQTVTTTTTYPNAAAVLVLDTSSSLYDKGASNPEHNLAGMTTAAKDFISSFAGNANGAKRYVAVVTFYKDVIGICGGWVDVTDSTARASLNTAIDAVYSEGTQTHSGTNTQGGLLMAYNLLKQSPVSGFTYKYAVLMTDGGPNTIVTADRTGDLAKTTGTMTGTYYYYPDANVNGWDKEPKIGGNNWWTTTEFQAEKAPVGVNSADRGDPSMYAAYRAALVADQIKNDCGATLYTIGYNTSTTRIFDPTYTDSNNSHIQNANDWLANSVASAGCAYNSGDASGLQTNFQAIVNRITVEANAWMVTDPMGQYIRFGGYEGGSTPQGANFSSADGTLYWDLHQAQGNTSGSQTTYSLTYLITLDTAAAGFKPYKSASGQPVG